MTLNVKMIAAIVVLTGLVAWIMPSNDGCYYFSPQATDC